MIIKKLGNGSRGKAKEHKTPSGLTNPHDKLLLLPTYIRSVEKLRSIHRDSVAGLSKDKSRFVQIHNSIRLSEVVKATRCGVERRVKQRE